MKAKNQFIFLQQEQQKSQAYKLEEIRTQNRLKVKNRLTLVDDQFDFALIPQPQSQHIQNPQQKIMNQQVLELKQQVLELKQSRETKQSEIEKNKIEQNCSDYQYCFKCDNIVNPDSHICKTELNNLQQIQKSISRISQTLTNLNIQNPLIYKYLIQISNTSDFIILNKINKNLKQLYRKPQIAEEQLLINRLINISGKKISILI